MSRFRGALVAAVLGDCVGGEFEGAEEVPMERVLQHLNSLDDDTKGNGERKWSVSLKQNVTAVGVQASLARPRWRTGPGPGPRPENTAMTFCDFHSFTLLLQI